MLAIFFNGGCALLKPGLVLHWTYRGIRGVFMSWLTKVAGLISRLGMTSLSSLAEHVCAKVGLTLS